MDSFVNVSQVVYKMEIPLPVLWRVGQRDDNVLVDEDEEGQEEAQAHGANDVHCRQPLKRSHVEDGPVVNFKDWNCWRKKKSYN